MKEPSRRKRARGLLSRSGYKAGGHVKHSDEAEDKALIKKEVKKSALKSLKCGGMAEGGKPRHRADKLARGGKAKKGHTKVTVNVINAHPNHPAAAKPMPVPVPVGGPPGGMPPPPPGAGNPGGMPPPGPNTMGLKRGGRAKINSQRGDKGGMPAGHFAKGGRTKGYPIHDGAGGGEGRLEKIKAYGAKV